MLCISLNERKTYIICIYVLATSLAFGFCWENEGMNGGRGVQPTAGAIIHPTKKKKKSVRQSAIRSINHSINRTVNRLNKIFTGCHNQHFFFRISNTHTVRNKWHIQVTYIPQHTWVYETARTSISTWFSRAIEGCTSRERHVGIDGALHTCTGASVIIVRT